MPTALSSRLKDAKAEALDALLAMLRDPASPAQARQAALAIFRLKSDDATGIEPEAALPVPVLQADTQKVSAMLSTQPPGLRPTEIDELSRFLPGVPIRRFTTKHSPVYWRAVLDEQRRLVARSSAPPPSGASTIAA